MPPKKSSSPAGRKKSGVKTNKSSSAGLSARDLKEMENALAEARKKGILPPDSTLDLTGMLAAAQKGLSRPGVARPAVSEKPFTLPTSKKAILLGAFIEPTLDNIPVLSKMLEARGYEVEPEHHLSLETLRNLPGKNIGVLYLATHATSSGYQSPVISTRYPSSIQSPTTYFSLGTYDNYSGRTAAARARRESDLKEGLVEKMEYRTMGLDVAGQPSPGGSAEGYSARMRFFEKYWRGKKIFSENSLVYISACDVDDVNFINLLIECGAGTVLAWTSNVPVGMANRTANYIFDRLLGTNMQAPEFYPEKFPQRPWTWSEIAVNIKLHKTPTGFPLGGPYVSPPTGVLTPPASLAVYNGNSAGAFLVPSVFFCQVDEFKKELLLHGWFGPDPGLRAAVTLYDSPGKNAKGKSLRIKKWDVNSATITCQLPVDGSITAGYIVIAVDGRRSNCLPLTEWKGEIVAIALGDQSLREELRINFSLRSDVHLSRSNFMIPLTKDAYQWGNLSPLAHAMVSSTYTSSASGSAKYAPPQQGLSAQSVTGKVSFRPASSAENGQLRIGKDLFNIALILSKTIGNYLEESFDLNLRVSGVSPKENGSQTLTWTKTKPGKPPETEDLPAGAWLWEFGDLVDAKRQKTYALPPLSLFRNIGIGPWKKAELTMTSSVAFAPDQKKGEDYFSVMK